MDIKHVQDVANSVMMLNDAELAALVSLLSGDYDNGEFSKVNTGSTMQTMVYVFKTARTVFTTRQGTLRMQSVAKHD